MACVSNLQTTLARSNYSIAIALSQMPGFQIQPNARPTYSAATGDVVLVGASNAARGARAMTAARDASSAASGCLCVRAPAVTTDAYGSVQTRLDFPFVRQVGRADARVGADARRRQFNIGDLVFLDNDADGRQSAGDTPVGGVAVLLLRCGGSGGGGDRAAPVTRRAVSPASSWRARRQTPAACIW